MVTANCLVRLNCLLPYFGLILFPLGFSLFLFLPFVLGWLSLVGLLFGFVILVVAGLILHGLLCLIAWQWFGFAGLCVCFVRLVGVVVYFLYE